MKKMVLMMACVISAQCYAAEMDSSALTHAVDAVVQPLKQKYDIPGIAIAVTVDGKQYFFNYGVASKQTRQPISNQTLFEIGSFSKTFAATLACDASLRGRLSLSDNASQYLPALQGTRFDHVSLLNLGTHTSGLPLFIPDAVTDDAQLMDYLKAWTPEHTVGTYRTYSNMGIGLLGMIAAKSMNLTYDDAIEKHLLPALGMTHSFINVPADQMKDYAQGYTKTDTPVRVNPGVLSSEAYGLKSGTADLIRYLGVNLALVPVNEGLQRAVACTHTGYYQTDKFVQDLIWEQYPYPAKLTTLVAGNGPEFGFNSVKVTRLTPPLPPQADYLLNKTGSTNGFSTYAAFIPAKKIGIVILANKSYPLDERVTAAYKILASFDNRLH